MKKNVIFLALAISIFTLATAFVSNHSPEINNESTSVPTDIITATTMGLSLDKSGELMIKDYDLFKSEMEKMLSDEGLDLKIKNILQEEAFVSGDITSQIYNIEYLNDSDVHALKVSFNKNEASNSAAVPICLGFRCTTGCNGQISAGGVFSCSTCVGPWSACFQAAIVPF